MESDRSIASTNSSLCCRPLSAQHFSLYSSATNLTRIFIYNEREKMKSWRNSCLVFSFFFVCLHFFLFLSSVFFHYYYFFLNISLKHLKLPKNHFKTNLFFSIFVGGDPPLVRPWSDGKWNFKPLWRSHLTPLRWPVSYRIRFMACRSFFIFFYFFR